jgi:hypothetical protein
MLRRWSLKTLLLAWVLPERGFKGVGREQEWGREKEKVSILMLVI